LLKAATERNNLTHFPCCKELAEELSNYDGSDFSTFGSNIEGMMEEFQTCFTDFEITNNDIVLFHNPFIVVNEKQPAQLKLEFCDLQADPILSTMKEKGNRSVQNSFYRNLSTIKRLWFQDEFYVWQHVLM
jgi:hypothetical protein